MTKKRTPHTPPLAIASLVLGILAFLFGWFPIIGWLLVLTALGISIAALVTHPKDSPHKGFAIAGVILSGASLLIGVIVSILLFVSSAGLFSALTHMDYDNSYAMDGAETSATQEATKVIKESQPGTIGTACNTTGQCATPAQYTTSSGCPYQAICLDGTCTLTCPQDETCATDEECDCTTNSYQGDGECRCIKGSCRAVLA